VGAEEKGDIRSFVDENSREKRAREKAGLNWGL